MRGEHSGKSGLLWGGLALVLSGCPLPPFRFRDAAAPSDVFSADQTDVRDVSSDTSVVPVEIAVDAFSDASTEDRVEAGSDVLERDVVIESDVMMMGPAPRLLRPLSGAVVFSVRPRLQWSAVPGARTTQVELCRERACSTVVQRLEQLDGPMVPSASLAAGTWFWRARAVLSDGTMSAYSPVWTLFLRGTSTVDRPTAGYFLDQNGDGLPEVAVGEDSAMSTREASVMVYAGGRPPLFDRPVAIPTLPMSTLSFAKMVARAGDVNGDGFGDLLVGDPARAGGWAYLYLGRSDIIPTASESILNRGTTISPPDFGTFGAVAGDVNGDGYADLVTSARGAGAAVDGEGYLFLGSARGPSGTPAYTVTPPPAVAASTVFDAHVGDVTGDGFDDVAFLGGDGINRTRSFCVLLGSEQLQPSGGTTALRISAARTNGIPSSGFGAAMVTVGDVNNDGRNDVLVGAYGVNGDTGAIYLYRGSATGVEEMPAAQWNGTEPGARLGITLAFAGDFNGDGFPDLAAGADRAGGAGRVHVYFGRETSAADPMPFSAMSSVQLEPPAGCTFLANNGLAGVGDINGDGFDDIAASCRYTSMQGAVQIYFGGSAPQRTRARELRNDPVGLFGHVLASNRVRRETMFRTL